jgi:hypothetical protein
MLGKCMRAVAANKRQIFIESLANIYSLLGKYAVQYWANVGERSLPTIGKYLLNYWRIFIPLLGKYAMQHWVNICEQLLLTKGKY